MEQLVAMLAAGVPVGAKPVQNFPWSFTNKGKLVARFGSPFVCPTVGVPTPAKREFEGMRVGSIAELGGRLDNGFAMVTPVGLLIASCTKNGGPSEPCRKFWLDSRWK